MNALKVATLLAVADSYGTTEPVVTAAHADWAIALIMRNIANMQTRLDGGDVGEGDGARERKLAAVLRHYMLHPLAASYKIPEAMRQASIVPVSYLLNRTAQHAAFYTHKLGSNWALRDALRSMVEAGYLMEVKKDATIEFYSYHGQAYRVLRLTASTGAESCFSISSAPARMLWNTLSSCGANLAKARSAISCTLIVRMSSFHAVLLAATSRTSSTLPMPS